MEQRVTKKISKSLYVKLGLTIAIILGIIWWTNYNSIKLELLGENHGILEAGEVYKEQGVKGNYRNMDISKDIVITDNIITDKLGEYEVTYTYESPDKKSKSIKRIVTVQDTTPPELKLNGGNEVTIVLDHPYEEIGFLAMDNYDKDLTSKVKVSGTVDCKVPGVYELKYTVADGNENVRSTTRNVIVTKNSPLIMGIKDFTLDGLFKGTILEKTEDAGEEYINSTIFVGDSITFNFAYYKNIPFSQVWAKPSLSPTNANIWNVCIGRNESDFTIKEAAAEFKPERMIITLGSNGIAFMKSDIFISNFETLIAGIEEVSPNTKIIVQSLFPVAETWDTRTNSAKTINNDKINKINYYLAEMCERLELKFLNTATVLKDEKGQMIKELCYASDGIHLTTEGNEKVMEYVRTHSYI